VTRQRTAQVLSIVVLIAALTFVIARRRERAGAPASGPGPQDAVYAMLDAARTGDVRAYLDSTTGALRRSLEQAAAESGQVEFARYLRESNAPIKGVAITEPEVLSEREVKMRIEYVYADRNEVQYALAEKQGSVWRISRLDAAERIRSIVPYGTPVDAER
jgi:hypothetical protein